MIKEWAQSNHRGTVMMSVLAVVSAILAFIQFKTDDDVRWIIGGVTISGELAYSYFVMVQVNVWLCAVPLARPVSPVRKLMRDWGLLEWGQALIGFAAVCDFAWVLGWPVR